jgi:hypothetical protein
MRHIPEDQQILMTIAGLMSGDPQQWYLYESQEQAFHPGLKAEALAARPGVFTDAAAVEEYALRIQQNPDIRKQWPKYAAAPPIRFVFEKREMGKWAGTDQRSLTIHLADNGGGNNVDTILHEMAHVITFHEVPGYIRMAGHGKEFAGIFLRLLEIVRGKDEAEQLRKEFVANHVEILEVV